MADDYKIVYNDGVLDVYYGDRHIVHQPYHPGGGSFDTEERAIEWWETQKYNWDSVVGIVQPLSVTNTENTEA